MRLPINKFSWLLAALASTGLAPAAELTRAQLDFFEGRIRPVLADKCYKCHSAQSEKVKGGLLLDSREDLLKGGKTGPAIVSGDPDKSLLIEAIRYTNEDLQMPPKGEKLSTAQIADLTAWVKMGAPDPRRKSATAKTGLNYDGDSGKHHWAWQPLKKPAVPESKSATLAATPVDNFIHAKLEANGLKPSAAADRRTLLRRATFDLTGLPPTQKEIDEFLNDKTSAAFATVVDRLLASPQYGERWGRYWLDIARYADTKGEVKRRQEDPNYPYAWTYRDYVIRAFNEDKPYNWFILEQLAADKLPGLGKSNLAALGFLTVGNHFNNNQNDIINDRIDVVTKGLLGLTVSCARCHDHKFDPIPTKDYYSLRGVFASSVEPETLPLLATPTATPAYQQYLKQKAALDKEDAAVDAERRAFRPRTATQEARRTLVQKEIQVRSRTAQLEINHPGAPARAMILQDRLVAYNSPVFIRGEAENKGPFVPRQFLEVLAGPGRQPFKNGSGRLELAQAIISKTNPMTARVMVNRIWQHHFGEGFVTTPDDFGTQSVPPSHPELIDWLASRFMEDGWSVKKMHRLIMLSSTYQQSSANNPRYAQIDPANRLLWRANIRRLEFESLRDSLLAIGGRLDFTLGGRPVDLGQEPYSTRRTVYGTIDRGNLPEILNQFDFANPDMTSGKRYETTVPQQALFFMNSPLVVEQARHLVALDEFIARKDTAGRIKFLYERIYQRDPRPEELQLGLAFLSELPTKEKVATANPGPGNLRRGPNRPGLPLNAKQQLRRGGGRPAFTAREPLNAWEEYAHALLQANETSFVN